MNSSDKLKSKLQADVETLLKLETYVRESAEICRLLDFETLNAQGYREIEALTARFERAQDFFVTKVLRTIDVLEGEDGMTIDVLNRSEKRGIIESAEGFLEMRRLRNKIAHEYAGYGPADIVHTVLDFVPTLLDAYQRTSKYACRPEFRAE